MKIDSVRMLLINFPQINLAIFPLNRQLIPRFPTEGCDEFVWELQDRISA